jgi:hypothetical protein
MRGEGLESGLIARPRIAVDGAKLTFTWQTCVAEALEAGRPEQDD